MAQTVWFTSDLHLGHSKFYELPFRDAKGEPVRPWSSVQEADAELVWRWNATVKPDEKTYILGDVAIPRSGLKQVERLNGRKILIAGNHDAIWGAKKLLEYFDDVRPYWKIDDFLLSHVPVHPGSLRKFHANIHGHLHSEVVLRHDGRPDPRYINVCVEHWDYRPVSLEEVRGVLRSRHEELAALQLQPPYGPHGFSLQQAPPIRSSESERT